MKPEVLWGVLSCLWQFVQTTIFVVCSWGCIWQQLLSPTFLVATFCITSWHCTVSNSHLCFDTTHLKNSGGTSSLCLNYNFKSRVNGALTVFWFIQQSVRLSSGEFLVKTLIQTSLSICDKSSSVVQFFHCSQVATGCLKTCALFFFMACCLRESWKQHL